MWTDKLAAGCCRDSTQSHITKSCFHFHTLQKPAWDNPLRHSLMKMFILFYTFPLLLGLYWKSACDIKFAHIDMWPASDRGLLRMKLNASIWSDFTVQSYLTIKHICKMKCEPLIAILDEFLMSVPCQQVLVQSPSMFSCDGFYNGSNWEC